MVIFLYFLFPPLTPPALSRPVGRKRELTAVFCRVLKQRQYKLDLKYVQYLKNHAAISL